MRILEIITPTNIGGAENYVVNLSKKLIEKGHEVHVITGNNEEFKEMLINNELPYDVINAKFKFDFFSIFKITKLIKKYKIDIIHTHLSKANFMGAAAGSITNVKSVATAHGINKKRQYNLSNEIICVSKAVYLNLKSQHFPEEKLHVIHNGVDADKFNPDNYKKKDIINEEIINIGMVSRLSGEKGVNIFLDSADLILQETKNVKFFIAGTGKLKDVLMEQTLKLNIDNYVYFIGFIDKNLAVFLNELDILVFPSLKEGLPLSLIEAMSMEKAVIVSKAGGMPEVVENGNNGYIVNIGDMAAIKDRVLELIKDKKLIVKCGIEARKTVLEKFNLDLMTDNTIKLFKEILERK
jgi:glycosyltransferase involved in cell wall biosynthesis